MKNGSSIRNIGIKRIKLLIYLHFILSEISLILSEICQTLIRIFNVRNFSFLTYEEIVPTLQDELTRALPLNYYFIPNSTAIFYVNFTQDVITSESKIIRILTYPAIENG